MYVGRALQGKNERFRGVLCFVVLHALYPPLWYQSFL